MRPGVKPMLRTIVAAVSALLLTCALPLNPARAAPGDLDRGVAIHDASVMSALEKSGLGIGSMLQPGWNPNLLMNNTTLSLHPSIKSADPSLRTIRSVLAEEFDSHVGRIKAEHPGVSAGVTLKETVRIFDRRFLTTAFARFELVGIVNRLDRAFKTPDTCGEVRLLYRLNYEAREKNAISRLPMTLNVVLKAKDPSDSSVTCQAIAQSWLWAGDRTSTGTALLSDLNSAQGPLRFIKRELIDRVEVNLQLDRWPTRANPNKFYGGNATYLLRLFKRSIITDGQGRQRTIYLEDYLENQIDRDRILADEALKARLKAFLLEPHTIRKLDAGTSLIPDEFLAKRAISVTPGNFARSANRPFEGVLTDGEIDGALRRLAGEGFTPTYIPTAAGFQHRLNDMSCTGCHQTRAIGGFHFMGQDQRSTLFANSVLVPGSPHFFGDAPRRRDITKAFADGQPPNFTKGFSSRPQRFRSRELVGTGLFDGWGAHCQTPQANGKRNASFASWTCAEGKGLRCMELFKSNSAPNMGVCVSGGSLRVGDPLDFGEVATISFGNDTYKQDASIDRKYVKRADGKRLHLRSPEEKAPKNSFWRYRYSDGSDGFASGNVRTTECPRDSSDRPFPKEAACGAKPRDSEAHRDCLAKPGQSEASCARYRPRDFHNCLVEGKTYTYCLENTTMGVGLRACDKLNPCRDDYICTETRDSRSGRSSKGACMPPYFLFQFRVDGHLHTIGEDRLTQEYPQPVSP